MKRNDSILTQINQYLIKFFSRAENSFLILSSGQEKDNLLRVYLDFNKEQKSHCDYHQIIIPVSQNDQVLKLGNLIIYLSRQKHIPLTVTLFEGKELREKTIIFSDSIRIEYQGNQGGLSLMLNATDYIFLTQNPQPILPSWDNRLQSKVKL